MLRNKHVRFLTSHQGDLLAEFIGNFNVNGQRLGDALAFQPVAWRIFSDDILSMGRKNWAEVFFVDEKDCLSAILFRLFGRQHLP